MNKRYLSLESLVALLLKQFKVANLTSFQWINGILIIIVVKHNFLKDKLNLS